jgi:hypothetical protein
MKIEQAQIEELRQKHGEVFEGVIDFNDADGNRTTVEFIYRRPKTSDVEAYSKNVQSVGVITGNLNMIQSLVVYPEPAGIVGKLREYPNAYGRFMEAVIQPFFGASVEARSRKL